MSRRRFSNAQSIVDYLLNRHERASGNSRPIAYIDPDGFGTVDERDAFDEDLGALERLGAVKLLHSGGKFDRVTIAARLADAEALYRWARRRPSTDLTGEALSTLARDESLPEGARLLVADVAAAWSRGAAHLGIRSGDAASLRQLIGLAVAIHARLSAPIEGDRDFRTFSRLAVGDSKALERNLRATVAVYHRIYGPAVAESPSDDIELLASAGVTRLPHPILVGGPISLGGQPIKVRPFVGIPTDCAENIALCGQVDYVLLVENFASFVRHVREIARGGDCLVLFTGGFPSRPTLRTIVRLAISAGAPTFHWGDMDAGGIRIFRHLELALEAVGVELIPHMMSERLLERFGTTAAGTIRLGDHTKGGRLAGLADWMERTGLVHEQEDFAPVRPGVSADG